MPNANEFLEKWYPKNGTCLIENEWFYDDNETEVSNFGKKREEVEKLSLLDWDYKNKKIKDYWLKLEKYLLIDGFTKLTILEVWNNEISSLDVNNCINLKILNCSRNKLTSLKIENLFNLRELNCNNNEIENLILSDLKSLEILYCGFNFLTEFSFLSMLNPEKMRILNIGENNIFENNLFSFSKFINLETLDFMVV